MVRGEKLSGLLLLHKTNINMQCVCVSKKSCEWLSWKSKTFKPPNCIEGLINLKLDKIHNINEVHFILNKTCTDQP